jgi:hypothetical protein
MTTEKSMPRWEGDPEEGLHVYIGDTKITPGRLAAEPATKMHRPRPDRSATAGGEPLRPFDAACPKCDAKGAGTRWQPGTTRLLRGREIEDANGPAEPGWMRRTCLNCEYVWAEAPVDAS